MFASQVDMFLFLTPVGNLNVVKEFYYKEETPANNDDGMFL